MRLNIECMVKKWQEQDSIIGTTSTILDNNMIKCVT